MAQRFELHPDHAAPRLLRQIADIVRCGGLIALPTDSAYALAGHLGDANLLTRIRRLRGVDERHHFTLMCRDLAEIATFARVDNRCYRLLKSATPGRYTFILEGSRELPRRVLHPKRKTVGLRIPDHKLTLALLAELNEPLLCSTLIPAGQDEPLNDADEIISQLGHQIDAVIDAGPCAAGYTSVVNLTGETPELVRLGCGALAPLGLAQTE